MTDYSTQIAALEAALASGELRVMSDGDLVIYRSITDLRKALDYFRGLQAGVLAPGGVVRPQTTLATYRPDF